MADLLCPVVIGRGAETEALRTALGAAAGGAGGVVFLVGEAGIGKSRLVAELAAEARARGVRVLAGRAVPASTASPYRPVTEALLQGLRGRRFPADGLTPWRSALRAIIPALAGASDQEGRESLGEGLGDHSPAVRGEAVLQLLRWLADPGGLLLVLEDLHWADPDTLSVLEYLADNLSAEPVLCLVTCRDESASTAAGLMARLRARRAAARIPLDRLPPGEVAAMVRACLPTAADDVIARVQRLADGIPFLVEESLAAPGVPSSFAEGVRGRLAGFSASEQLVLHIAALFGRHFDWRLLPQATGLPADVVAAALERGVTSQLLAVDSSSFRFRHMLTREAVAAEVLPPRRVTLAAQALAALEAAHPELSGAVGDVAAELAIQAEDQGRAGSLLTESGRSALSRGALATAVGTLRRAADLLTDPDQLAEAETLLVEALALAGRVDEALQIGDCLIAQLTPGGGAAARRAVIHLKLAHAAVDGTRWTTARRHIGIARDLLAAHPEPGLLAKAAVLDAEVALADDEADRAHALAENALTSDGVSAEIRCRALELLGRVRRVNDLDGARDAFEQALAMAEAAGLAVWRLRALHELGTIDMFDHGGTARLSEARRISGELGAASTGAVIDLQLTAVAMFRFELDEAERHAMSALAASTRLGLSMTNATVLVFRAEICALRREAAEMERFIALACAAAPGDPEIEGSALAGARAMLALLDGDMPRAMDAFGRGIAVLDSGPQRGPAPYRGMWPLLLAAQGDVRAATAISHARAIGLTVNRANRGLLGYADAILAGRAGDGPCATAMAAEADLDLQHYPVWHDLARLAAAEPALASGWGQPRPWLEAAAAVFSHRKIEPLAARCRQLLDGPRPSRWSRLGITDRQADVLRLVAMGISNKEIAARLHLSPRTVEKHVENLLRITAAQSRTQLVALAGPETDLPPRPVSEAASAVGVALPRKRWSPNAPTQRGASPMPLHTQVEESSQDDAIEVNPVYVQELNCEIPRYKLPEHGALPRTALQIVRDELILDGNARLNLATFVTTWMEPEADQLMAECAAKNMIDKDEYPQTAELERRCVNILSDLWNSPGGNSATGCSTTGSSEACMLGGMALLWRWRARRRAAGQDATRPNLVMGSNVQVCWEKFCRYWQVEPRYVPMVPGRLHLRGAEAAAECDENTIGVVAIMGSTMDGSYEPVLEISQALDRLQAERGHDIPVHVDAASGGFVAPFIQPELEWDFRVSRVASINSSGHKYGLVYPGVGWIIWRDAEALPDDLVFRVNYLGGQMPTFALNFSRPGAQVAAQYFNFVRLGHRGFQRVQQTCQDIAVHLSGEIAKIGPFELLTEGRDLPVFAFKLREEVTGYTVFDLSERLRMRGWQVPAYTFPKDMTDTAVMRIVIRNGFSIDLANLLLDDIRLHVRFLEHHPQTQPPPEIQRKRESFRH